LFISNETGPIALAVRFSAAAYDGSLTSIRTVCTSAPSDRRSPFARTPQHPAANEWVIEMQVIDPPHDREIGGTRGPGQIIDARKAIII
jgi:hypothetical protein